MSATTLKLIAVFAMTLDHLSAILGLPVWLRYFGRFAAVIFFFCAAESAAHTHNRKAYLKRLYIMSLAMPFLSLIVTFLINGWIPNNQEQIITNNIFAAIFHGVLLIDILEDTHRLKRLRNYLLWQGGAMILLFMGLSVNFLMRNTMIEHCFYALIGFAPCAEGGTFLLLMIPLFYFCRNNKKKLAACFSGYCLTYSLIVLPQIPARISLWLRTHDALHNIASIGFFLLGFPADFNIYSLSDSLFRYHFQWMMIFTLPLLLCYNGQKGRGLKRFFYAYYPAHIYVLHLIAALVIKFTW